MTVADRRASRPIRAAGILLVTWVVGRSAILMSTTADPPATRPIEPAPLDPSAPLAAATPNVPESATARHAAKRAAAAPVMPSHLTALPLRASVSFSPQKSTAALPTAMRQEPVAQPVATAPMQLVRTDTPVASPSLPLREARQQRWSLSGWLLARGPGQSGRVPGGSLGGAQAGLRAYYAPGPRAVALTVRISAPLSAKGGEEASVGIALRKGGVALLIEERIPLGSGRTPRPSVTLAGGVSDVALPLGLRLSGYGQAGVTGLKNRTGFADGAVQVERAVAGRAARVSVGAGIWGGVQPGLARLDIGPEVSARLRVQNGGVRIGASWRWRIAGDAAPGSGPVLSLGTDF